MFKYCSSYMSNKRESTTPTMAPPSIRTRNPPMAPKDWKPANKLPDMTLPMVDWTAAAMPAAVKPKMVMMPPTRLERKPERDMIPPNIEEKSEPPIVAIISISLELVPANWVARAAASSNEDMMEVRSCLSTRQAKERDAFFDCPVAWFLE